MGEDPEQARHKPAWWCFMVAGRQPAQPVCPWVNPGGKRAALAGRVGHISGIGGEPNRQKRIYSPGETEDGTPVFCIGCGIISAPCRRPADELFARRKYAGLSAGQEETRYRRMPR